jgi:hypothetical protein
MERIDTAGVYRGLVTESAIGSTKKGFPQWIGRLQATEKWVENEADLAYFLENKIITEAVPQWVPWNYDQDILAYSVLFNSEEVFNETTALMNYEQLKLALGWDGTEFDSLNGDEHLNKTILFRVEEDTYQDKTSLKVNWIDHKDASPARELKKADAEKVKSLNSRLQIAKTAKPTAVAKPPAKPAAAPAPVAKTTPAPAPAPRVAPKAPPAAPAPKAAPAAPAASSGTEAAEAVALPPQCTKEEAWGYLFEIKGAATEDDVVQAWLAAMTEVCEGRTEDQFTNADWAKVRDAVKNDLALG